MILHVLEAEVCGPQMLKIKFSNGKGKKVDLTPLLDGPIFEPLKNQLFFAKVKVDPIAGTVAGLMMQILHQKHFGR